MKPFPIVAVFPLVIVLAAGCAKAPADKLASAEQAVTGAQTVGAPAYMAEDFAKLQGMLTAAKQELADQNNKFAFLRDYDQSEHLLTAVQADATRVAAETGMKKDEAKAAAVQSQQAAQESVKKAQDLVALAPVGKDRAALQEIKSDVGGLAASVGEVQAAIDAGDYKAAQAKGQAILDKSQQVSTEIEHALAKARKTQSVKKR
ncbi:MAG: hypothetical protein ACREJU_17265 [Nitrospiraceae bacterium]